MNNQYPFGRPLFLVPCPHCKAKVGRPCRRPSGRTFNAGHDDRLMALQKSREMIRAEGAGSVKTRINGIPVTVNEFEGALVVDCHNSTDRGKPSGPRFWLARTLKPSGWKLIVHPDDGDATHCIHIPDKTKTVKVLHDDDPQPWPESV